MSDRRVDVYWQEWDATSEMPLTMVELGHRAWYALETGQENWIQSMLNQEAAPESGVT